MSLSLGIVGLPNVGKSTLFNALLKKQQALAANYPFATIEPNVGIVDVPDYRLERLTELAKAEFTDREGKKIVPESVVPAVVKFYDIAGLVKGAHKGEGLGNQFLAHIREVDAIVHVVRAFDDENVSRAGSINPKEDIATINTELAMADIAVLEKHLYRLQGVIKKENTQKNRDLLQIADKYLRALNEGKMINLLDREEEEIEIAQELSLLTSKPVLFVYNVNEEDVDKAYMEVVEEDAPEGVVLCAKVESEICSLPDDEQVEYLKSMGLHASGLDKVITHGYKILGLETFFTYGPKEVRAWTYKKGTKAPQAAGIIHTDFERGFIAAEVISFKSLAESGSWKNAKEKGLLKTEGKSYVIKDGDTVVFRFSV